MAITMMQLLMGLTGFVGCITCMSLIRTIIGLSATITAMGVANQTDIKCVEGNESYSIETTILLIILCVHLFINFLFGRVSPGNLNYAMIADIFDWIGILTEYVMAIHLLGYFKQLKECIIETEGAEVSLFLYDPNSVWDLLVTWITFDTILFVFRLLVTYILYRKMKSKGHQQKYIIS
eukprot:336594_1